MKTTLTCKASGHEDHAYKELFNILGMVGFYAGIEPENGELNLNKLLKRINDLNEKDTAKQVIDMHTSPSDPDYLEGECSSCQGMVVTDIHVDITRHCRWCGQKLKWGEL